MWTCVMNHINKETCFRAGVGVPDERCTDRASQPPENARTVVDVENRAEVREFLISRRAKITPQQAGLPEIGNRRVPGLRRGEVAALAGVSIEYYAKLERGALAGVSATILDAIARALQLDDAERAHLFHLAHAADGTSAGMRPRRPPAKLWTPRPSLQWVLDKFSAPFDTELHDLVGELSAHSEDFRRRWSAHNVRYHGAGAKRFHHHVAGDLRLAYESVDMISEPGFTLTLYAAEPASPTAQALDLLAAWAASQGWNGQPPHTDSHEVPPAELSAYE